MLTALLCAAALTQPELPFYEPHSGMWLNLHHVLYELGRRERVARGAQLWGPPPFEVGPDVATLSPPEREAWQRAVSHYAAAWAGRDLLFDQQLAAIKAQLSAREDDEALVAELPADTLAVLNAVAPIYRRVLWPQHDAANRRWLAEHAADVASEGPPVAKTLKTAFAAPFPPTPIRLDLVAVANWGGGYTSTGPLHVTLSSLDPRVQGRAGTELLFHETAHGMTEALERAISEAATRLGLQAPPQLWHATLFFTVGEAFRKRWPGYQPYAEAQGVYARGWAAYLPALRELWLPRLEGQGEGLPATAEALLKKVGAPDVEQANAAAQTVVTGTRTPQRLEDVVIPTEVITRAQLEAVGARDLQALLLQQPGVEVEYSFRGAAVSLQGLGPEYVLVLVDGARQTGRVGNVLDLTRYSLRDVERIELVKGPAAALYGSDAIGGVINLITRRPQQALELAARVQGGLTNAAAGPIKADVLDLRANAGTKLGWFEGRVGGGYQTSQPYDLDPRDAATSGAGLARWDVDGMLAADLGSVARVSARADYLRRDLAAVDLAPSGAVFDRRQRSEQFGASVRLDVQPLEHTHVMLRGHTGLFRDQLQQDQRGAAYLDQYSASLDRLYSVDAQLDTRLLDQHGVTLGAEFLAERLFSTRISRLAERYRVGLFVQDEWDVPELVPKVRLKLLPGLRADIDSQFSGAATPRLAVKLDPHPAVTLRVSYGWGFRAPSFQELYLLFENTSVGYVVEGNPKLKPESSQALNLAADWRLPPRGWVLSAGVFHTELQDLIDIDTSQPIDPINPTRFRYGNVASAYTQGAELSLRGRICPGAYFDLGYVLTDARDNARRGPLAGRAPHKVSAQAELKYRERGLGLLVRATWLSPRPFYQDEQLVWTRGLVNLDAQLTWKPFSFGSAFVGFTNLLSSGDPVWVPQPPRRFTAGVQLEY